MTKEKSDICGSGLQGWNLLDMKLKYQFNRIDKNIFSDFIVSMGILPIVMMYVV